VWAARIESPEFLAYYEDWLRGTGFRLGLLSKSRCLVWLEHEERGPSDGDGPSRRELTKMAKTRCAAIDRFYKTGRDLVLVANSRLPKLAACSLSVATRLVMVSAAH
jgi:hypothetical protein